MPRLPVLVQVPGPRPAVHDVHEEAVRPRVHLDQAHHHLDVPFAPRPADGPPPPEPRSWVRAAGSWTRGAGGSGGVEGSASGRVCRNCGLSTTGGYSCYYLSSTVASLA